MYGLQVRFQNGGMGEELHYLNTEVHNGAKREQALSYDYKEYPGTHQLKATEFKDAFDFVITAMKNPLPLPERWHHADLYPEFGVWDYQIKSDLREPGYIDLQGVTKGGFGIRTRKWQPDGPVIPGVNIAVVTAPLYKPNTTYSIIDHNVTDQTQQSVTMKTDHTGRLHFNTDGKYHQFGINQKNSNPELVCVAYKVNDSSIFLPHQQPGKLKLCLLNKGGNTARNLTVKVNTETGGVAIRNPVVTVSQIKMGKYCGCPLHMK